MGLKYFSSCKKTVPAYKICMCPYENDNAFDNGDHQRYKTNIKGHFHFNLNCFLNYGNFRYKTVKMSFFEGKISVN